MSLIKLGRPYQNIKPGGCAAHVKAYLTQQPGTARNISDATGYKISTVQNEIAELKNTDPELAKRVIDGRKKAKIKPPPKPRTPPREWHVLPTAAEVVESALQTRTDIEKVWK